jgi:hypothetical protein
MAKDEQPASIIETIQKRMADPNYIPTGPTYGELMHGRVGGCYRCAENGHPCHPSYHQEWDRAVLAERERCARVVEAFVKEYWFNPDMPEITADIAAAIRSGK